MATCGLVSILLWAVAAATAQAPRWQVDTDASQLVVVLHKAGLLRFLGHEHGILARDWAAEVRWDEENPSASRVSVTVPVVGLEIDSREARAAAGVDPDGPGEEDLVGIRDEMLGPELLAAEDHPEVRFESDRVETGGDDEITIFGTLTIRGVSRGVRVPARLRREGEGLRVTGELRIEHRDFGMEPVSIGGVVRVADEIDIRFDVRARPPSRLPR